MAEDYPALLTELYNKIDDEENPENEFEMDVIAIVEMEREVSEGGFVWWLDGRTAKATINRIKNVIHEDSELKKILDKLEDYYEDYGPGQDIGCERCGNPIRCRCGTPLPDWIVEVAEEWNSTELRRLSEPLESDYFRFSPEERAESLYRALKNKYPTEMEPDIKMVIV